MSTIDEIKARVDIVDLVSETVQLRRTGKNYTGFCPFHSNTRTPAFVVFSETGSWRCFGQCNEGGDIFGFVMKKEGWDFGEALKYLADKAGIELKPSSFEEQVLEANQALRFLLEEAVVFYKHHLLNTPAGKQVLEYLHRQRNLSDEMIEVFGLGYAPDAWEAGLAHFRSKGYSQADLIASGLVTERDAGEGDVRGVYDRFRNRLMIPIRDERGRMAGFGARVVDPEDVPKFLNSPQTALFDKGRLLYGLDRARKEIRARDQVVIVEGYLDVIALHQAGFANVVSPMGTALTEAQLRLVKRFSRRVVLALDADAAGDQATLRGLQLARQAMDRETDPVFDARGLLGYEGRLQADIRVTTLPPGMDPDEVVARDPQEWERIVSGARPIVIHVMETLAKNQDLEDSKAKSGIAAQVLPLIEEVADPVEREDYRQRLARLLRVDERVLRETTRPQKRRERAKPQAGARIQEPDTPSLPPIPARASSYRLEEHCLSVLMRRPDMVFRIDRALQEYGLVRLSMDDFQSADHQVLFGLIGDSLSQVHAEPLIFVLNGLSLPLMELADQLLSRTQKLDPNEERVLEDVIRTLLVLRQHRLHQQMDHLRFLMEEAQRGGDSQAGEYQKTMVEYILARSRLDRAYGRFTVHAV